MILPSFSQAGWGVNLTVINKVTLPAATEAKSIVYPLLVLFFAYVQFLLKLFSAVGKSTTWLFLAGFDMLSVIVTRRWEVPTLVILLMLQGIPSSLLIIDDGYFCQELFPCQVSLL